MVPITTDFRTGFLFEEVLQDGQLDDLEKLRTALDLYFPGVVSMATCSTRRSAK